MPGDVSWWWSCRTGPPPSTAAWISNVSLVKISILRRSTWKSAWCSCHATQSSASQRSFPLPGIVLVTSIAQLCHLCCVWTTLSPITASLTSRQEVVVEPALKKWLRWHTVEMAFEPGQWQCWSSPPPRHQLQDLPPPPNWWKFQTRFPPLFLPLRLSPRWPCTSRFLKKESIPRIEPESYRISPKLATIWRMMLDPARDQRSCNPSSGDRTSQFSLLWAERPVLVLRRRNFLSTMLQANPGHHLFDFLMLTCSAFR